MTESVETVHSCTGTECGHWSHWYGIERTDDTTMTDRTLYSINIEALSPIERELLEDWLELGRAVKVEPCIHGNTGRHIDEDTIRMKDWVEGTTGYEDCEYDWCDGKPEDDNE